jgi:hypothetical protein
MADQVNENGNENPVAAGSERTSQTQPSSRPDDAGTGDNPAGKTDDDKAEAMEDVQRDAAKEREENRGYQ